METVAIETVRNTERRQNESGGDTGLGAGQHGLDVKDASSPSSTLRRCLPC